MGQKQPSETDGRRKGIRKRCSIFVVLEKLFISIFNRLLVKKKLFAFTPFTAISKDLILKEPPGPREKITK